MRKIITILIVLIVLIIGCEKRIGGDTDEGGCLIGAGYSYNKDIGACIRSWELDESQQKAAKIAVENIDPIKGTTITKVETLRCPGCFDVYIKLNLNSGEQDMLIRLVNWEVSEEVKEITNFEECAAAGNPVMESYPRQCGADGKTFTEVIKMDIEEAEQIAEKSECKVKGDLIKDAIFNENTNTWWINLEIKPEFAKEGCSPACVISTVTKEAEINWRCTGLIIDEMDKELCESARGHWNECGSRCQIDNQGKEGVACTLQCEQICECGGIAGFRCPSEYTCKMPAGIADAMGYCVRNG